MDANSKLQALRSSVVSLNPRRSMQEPNLWQGRAHIVFAEFLPQNTFLFRLPFGTWISWRNRVFQCGFNVFHVFCLWRAVSCTSKRPRPQEVQRRLGAEWHGMTETIRPLSPQVFFKTNWWGINGSDVFCDFSIFTILSYDFGKILITEAHKFSCRNLLQCTGSQCNMLDGGWRPAWTVGVKWHKLFAFMSQVANVDQTWRFQRLLKSGCKVKVSTRPCLTMWLICKRQTYF